MSITIPLEDNYEATLTQALDASVSALTIYVSRVPVATIPANKEIVMTINPKKGFTRQENVLIESYDETTKTLTVKSGGRAQSRYNGDSPSALSHAVGSKIIISDAYPVWNALDDFMPIAGGTFTGAVDFSGATATFRLPNLTTAQRDALASPQNGMKIYNTTTGEEQVYNGGSWYALSAGSTQPNASETVAGKVEQATLAEQIAKTETGATGAPLFINPKQTSITSSDAAEGKLVQLNSSLKVDNTLIDRSAQGTSGTANTTIASGEVLAFNGNNRLDLADGNDSTINSPFMLAGISTAAGSSGDSVNYSPVGSIVTVKTAFTLSNRANCRLWLGESNATSNTTTDTISSITAWRCQTFIPQTGHDNVGHVLVNITNSSLVGTMQCKIYTTSGGLPTGAALGSATALSSFSSGDLTFEFSTPVSVTPGTTYAIVVYLSAYTSGNFAWNYNNSSVYASGQSGTSSDSGGSWTAESTYDRRFSVYYRGIAGEPVYLSDTAGGLSLTPGTYVREIGQAISTTQMMLNPSPNLIRATYTFSDNPSGETVDTEITVGFRAKKITALIYSTTSNNVLYGAVSIGTWVNGNGSNYVHNYNAYSSGTPTNSWGASHGAASAIGYLYCYNATTTAIITFTVQSVSANTVTIRRVVNAHTASGIVPVVSLIIE